MRSMFRNIEFGDLVETSDPSADPVEYSSQGGGLVYLAPVEWFHANFRPEPNPQHMTKRLFTGDWWPDGEGVRGYDPGFRWNGWAIPYFTLNCGLFLCKLLPHVQYCEYSDSFIETVDGYEFDDQPAPYRAQYITYDGGQIKVYSIGGQSWCWDRA